MSADAHELRAWCDPIDGSPGDYDALIDQLGGCETVLIGEASHGTHDFYHERARITRRLIDECGFDAVAIEGDWPDAWRVHEYVNGVGADHDAVESLGGFERFPSWMWRNADVLDFIGWLREHNEGVLQQQRVELFGLDLYSLYSSMTAVIDYLQAVDPEAARRAELRYDCLDGQQGDPHQYATEVDLGLRPSCEREVLAQLLDLRQVTARNASSLTMHSPLRDSLLFARQNAVVVRNAERYYRTMFWGSTASWNLRDSHMFETLSTLQRHIALQRDRNARIVVWAHNSHVGDARATEMGRRGQSTLGELVRQVQGTACALIGLTTWHGTVSAARDWDLPVERRRLLPALAGSYEDLLHGVGLDRFVILPDGMRACAALAHPELQRAVGVIYRPETERNSHYFHAVLKHQFDALVHIDETRAVEPLEIFAPTPDDEFAETYPFET